MQLVLRFWIRVALWTAGLVVVFTAIPLIAGMGLGNAIPRLAVWGGLALVLAAFPAGIAVAKDVFPETGRPSLGPSVAVSLGALALSLAVLVLGGWVGPTLVKEWAADLPTHEPAMMTLPELRAEAASAVRQAEAAGEGYSVSRWQRANTLVWQYVRRLAGGAQPFLFAWLGVLTAFWARWSPRPEIAQAQYWLMGLFLVVSTYLAGENSYELIALQAGGPAFFAGWFVLMVPTLLVIGLGWPAVVALWQRRA